MSTGLIIVQALIFIILFGAPLTAFLLYRQMRTRQQRLNWEVSQSYSLIEVLVPKKNEKSPLAAEQMLASLHGIYRESELYQYQLSFEMAAHEQFIHFYIRVPTHLKDFLEGQLYAQYPAIEIKDVDDYTQHDFSGQVIASSQLQLTKPDVYPIKTFQSFDVDPMSAITAVLGKVSAGEQAWIQLIIRPVPDDWQLKGISFASAKRSGESQHKPSWWQKGINVVISLVGALIKAAAGAAEEAPAKKGDAKKLSAPEEAAVKGIETKITKLGFETTIRIVTIASDEFSARSRIEGLTGAYKQFNTTNLNGFKASGITIGDAQIDDYRQRRFPESGSILNIEELASLYHFPAESVETPNIVWAGSKKGEPPANLPFEGNSPPEELTVFGETDFRSLKRRFGIKRGDRRLHMYAIGKTGTGKSTLLENMIIDDIQKGKGVAVVDPHGDLVDHVLNFIPDHRIDDVIYFNPADREFPIGFNLLESLDPNLKNIAASGLMSIFTKLWENVWSARMEYILRNTILALLEYPESTFLEIMKLLNDGRFRKNVLSQVQDPVIRDFFLNEFERYEPKFRTEAIAPIQNKVGQFLSSDTIRNIVGQKKSSFDIRQAMDQRKILLIDLSTGKIGEDNAALLGAMMITKIQLAAMTRVDIPEAERVDFYLYVDEFQNFATDSFAVILSEARKYRLNLILTNQYIAQMPETVAKAIFGNVGTLVAFRVGSSDGAALAKELEPVFDANDLVNLDNYHIYLKMSIDGVTRPAFSSKTLPPFKGANDNRERIIETSRERYTKSRAEVEAAIAAQAAARDGMSGDVHDARYEAAGSGDAQNERPAGPRYRRLGKSSDGVVWYGQLDENGEFLVDPALKTPPVTAASDGTQAPAAGDEPAPAIDEPTKTAEKQLETPVKGFDQKAPEPKSTAARQEKNVPVANETSPTAPTESNTQQPTAKKAERDADEQPPIVQAKQVSTPAPTRPRLLNLDRIKEKAPGATAASTDRPAVPPADETNLVSLEEFDDGSASEDVPNQVPAKSSSDSGDDILPIEEV